jgi:hypothetical protein
MENSRKGLQGFLLVALKIAKLSLKRGERERERERE